MIFTLPPTLPLTIVVRVKLISTRFYFSVPLEITNLVSNSLASDSVTLTWTRSDTNCPILQYFVSYSGSVLWNDEEDQNSVTVDGTTAEYKATGLTPYTNYSFCVVANNDMRNGTAVCVEDIVTLEGSKIITLYEKI